MKRTMIHRAMLIGCTCAGLALAAGCGNGADTAGSDDDFLSDVDVDIPTQEEADTQAAREITPENADEAFRELEEEILSEDDDL